MTQDATREAAEKWAGEYARPWNPKSDRGAVKKAARKGYLTGHYVAEARLLTLLEKLNPVYDTHVCAIYTKGAACDCGADELQEELEAEIKRIKQK